MSEYVPKREILQQLGMKDDFKILDELAGKSQSELQRILWTHDEADSRQDPDRSDAKLRRRLDEALNALTLLEIGLQVGVYRDEHRVAIVPASFTTLVNGKGSDAFLRYVSAYLYFGVRMLADRQIQVDWGRVLAERKNIKPCRRTDPQPPQRPDEETNLRLFQIAHPPSPTPAVSPAGDPFADPSSQFTLFLSLQKGAWEEALDFLDDVHEEAKGDAGGAEHNLGESARYELWLRGLFTDETSNDEASAWATPEQELERSRKSHEARSRIVAQRARFERITSGLMAWLDSRVAFYLPSWSKLTAPQKKEARHNDGRLVTNPVAARFALADIYWIARLLRADVSGKATVTYSRTPWIQMLRFHATLNGKDELGEGLRDQQEIIRSVFDFVCDLAQNAVSISEEIELRNVLPEEFHSRHKPEECTWPWRPVFDEELTLIERRRSHRSTMDGSYRGPGGEPECGPPGLPWSRRLLTGVEPHNRVGLAFSGGGIRSASFNLGVLQGLQGFDLLGQVDYLSTVSGGGFIGAWLVGNVRRTRHWLGKGTCWDESVAHLRAYSSYLAPITGILSADTWVLAASWIRNTFLIQLSGLASLFSLLLLVLLSRTLFLCLVGVATETPGYVGVLVTICALLVIIVLIKNFIRNRTENGKDLRANRKLLSLAVLPAWLGSFFIATMLWAEAQRRSWVGCDSDHLHDYSSVLLHAFRPLLGIMIGDWLGMLLIGWVALKPTVLTPYVDAPQSASMNPEDAPKIPEDARKHEEAVAEANVPVESAATQSAAAEQTPPGTPAATQTPLHHFWAWIKLEFEEARPIRRRLRRALGIGTFCVVVLYLALCAILYLFLKFIEKGNLARIDSFAFTFGPALVLTAFTLSVVFFIGLSGRVSNEPQREWWTRYGAWLTIFATIGLGLSGAAVFGPRLVVWLVHKSGGQQQALDWKSVASVITTIVGGLFAGNSSKTTGSEDSGKKFWLELLAKLGALVFVITFVIGTASVLYYFLLNFAPDEGPTVSYWQTLNDIDGWTLLVVLLVVGFLTYIFSRYFDINLFGLSQFYRNRLVRCYLGATRWAPGVRKPHPFTKFDFDDEMFLSDLKHDSHGPFPIFNCTLNLAGSTDLSIRSRHSASFSLTPLRCGADRHRVGYAPTGNSRPDKITPSFAGGVQVGQAVAVSGAAVSANMGYNTSPLVALLLTMFNVRLGWWFPNPSRSSWQEKLLPYSFTYLIKELFGIASDNRKFLDISDGGHFENLGVYELVRRRCKVIIASDAECDESLQFGGLGNLVRLCATDFGAVIDIDVKAIREQKDDHSLEHCTVGKIKYSNGSIGYLIYLKASVTGDEDIGTAQYRSTHPSFPHETTSDQFFTEDQFESYRKLGLHIVRYALRGTLPGATPMEVAEKLADVFAPKGVANEAFLRHTKTLQHLWSEFGRSAKLHPFILELMSRRPPTTGSVVLSDEELCISLALIQLMEDVFMDLRLDDFWEHPDNRGWAIMFMRWARSPRFQRAWMQTRRTFGIRFEYFCEARLGLTRDHPIVRV